MNNIDIVFAICVDNADPNNAHRIRFYEVNNLSTLNKTYQDVLNIVTSQDSQKKYIPWQYSTDKLSGDPFLAETFLPKYINMVPEKGQLVKLFKYNLNAVRYEYLGPVTSDLLNTKENFLLSLQKTRQNNNGDSGVVPNTNILPITGKNNEQILIGNNQIVDRLNYVTNQKSKNSNYPFVQFAEYPVSFDVTTEQVTTTTDVDYPIDFIVSVNFIYMLPGTEFNGNSYVCNINVFDSSKMINNIGLYGLKKSQVSFTDKFRNSLPQTPVIKFSLETNNVKKLLNEFTNILTSLKNKQIYKFPQDYTTPVYTYTDQFFTLTIDNEYGFSPNSGGGLPDNPGVILNDSFAIVKDINQISYSTLSDYTLASTYNITDVTQYPDFTTLGTFISNGKYENFVTKLTATTQTTTTNQDTDKVVNQDDSYWINHVNKILLYSTKNAVPLTTSGNESDAATHDRLIQLFKNNGSPDERFRETHPMVRGDKMISIIIQLISLLLTHGHEAGLNPPESLDKTSQKLLADLIKTLQQDLIDDTNSVTLNHNIRLN